MAVGVELAGLFAVGLLDLVRARLLRDAEDRIEVLVEPVLLGHVMRLLPGASGWELSGGTERGLPAGGGRQAPLRWCCTDQARPRVPTRAGRRMRACRPSPGCLPSETLGTSKSSASSCTSAPCTLAQHWP